MNCISKMVLKWRLVNISSLVDESSLCNDWRTLVPIMTELILNAISDKTDSSFEQCEFISTFKTLSF